jgi:gliding motility-associated-like protein
MNRLTSYILTLLTFLCLESKDCYATHIFGADFYYEHITGNDYRVSIAFYGDCGGQSFILFPSSTPEIELLNNNQFVSRGRLYINGPGEEVTPVCFAEVNNTTCRGGSIPGVTRFIYSNVFTIPSASAGWKFRFTGIMDSLSGGAGRSISINNLTMPANGSIMVLEATLNNLNGNNSSPRFTTIPTPFYCVNKPQQYNQGAVDPDGDSLSYAMASALDRNGNSVYKNGFSPADPLGQGPSSFLFNILNGQMDFTPTYTQNAVVVNSVAEYKNGQMVGSSMREMTFVILGSCNNSAPEGWLDTANASFSGGVLDTADNLFTVCEGTGSIFFKIHATDPDNDRINVTANGLPAGASLNILNNNTQSPDLTFNWSLNGAAPGNYNFFITFKDEGCPLSSQRTIAYTVRVIRPNTLVPEVIHPSECRHKAYVRLSLANGTLPRQVVIRQGANTVFSFSDNTGTFTDSLAAGNYTYSITSPGTPCTTNGSFTIKDTGVFPYPPIIDTAFYCKGATAMTLSLASVAGSSIFWYDSLGTRLSQPPVPNTAVEGVFTWYASASFSVCESAKVPYKVFVTQRPVADITVVPEILCTRDVATVTFTGTIGAGPFLQYLWNWDDGIARAGAGLGPWKIQWPAGGTKQVTLQVLENKCPSNIVSKNVLVKPTPVAAFYASRGICQYDTLDVAYAANPLPGQQYAWAFGNGTLTGGGLSAPGPFRVNWPTTGIKELSLIVSKDGCADTLIRQLTVHEVPEALILTVPATVCLGDKIFLEHTGKGSYQWTPALRISPDIDGRLYTHVVEPTTYKLTITSEFGCVDSASITYDHIEPCCNFSYPNAFTPNNDGRNDVFRVITYGNDADFSLSVYNRWGQRIYYSGNAKEGWDGRVNGKDADAGTYFYVLKAKCLTGHEENQKGEFTLIR